MALPELLSALERNTEAEISALRAAAQAEAARLEAEGERARDERLAAAIARLRAERQAVADRALATASRRARADVLTARAAMLERIRASLAGALPALLADPRVATGLLAAALAACGDRAGTLRCAPAIAPVARAAAPPAIRVEPDPAVATGAVIELANGTAIDATLAALLEGAWPELACEALAWERAR